MLRRCLFNAATAAALLLGVVAAHAENRLALVIGQSAYRAVTPLPNPGNDAKAMAELLGEAGFEVTSVSDLSQAEMQQAVSDFAAQMATKGPDTVALVFYAGHGLQIDGENFLVPVDVNPKREADIPLQAVRLNDILNTLASAPSRMRIVLLDACRNNPFPEINRTAGRGLAIVDAKYGAPGTFLSFSTSPGAEAEDGSGQNSPYTTALLAVAKEPDLSIEDAFKRVRVSVNKVTEGRQTPWESSSLTDDFRFFKTASEMPAKPAADRQSPAQWQQQLKGKSPEVAYELIVADGSVEAYQAFVTLYEDAVFAPRARGWLERYRRMEAWSRAVIENTADGFRAFLAAYPDSDLTPTARKLEERLRNRPVFVRLVEAGAAAQVAAVQPTTAPASGPSCSCNAPAPAKRAEKPSRKRATTEPARRQPPRYMPPPEDDEVIVYRRPPPVYVPLPGPYYGGRGGYRPYPSPQPSLPPSTGRGQRGLY